MFKNLKFILLFILASFSINSRAAESQIVFICHAGLHYSAVEVGYAFKAYLDEPRPIDNRELFPEMLKSINYSAERYHKSWQKNAFRRGLFVPHVATSDAEVIHWVATNYGGVGYVHQTPSGNSKVEVCGK